MENPKARTETTRLMITSPSEPPPSRCVTIILKFKSPSNAVIRLAFRLSLLRDPTRTIFPRGAMACFQLKMHCFPSVDHDAALVSGLRPCAAPRRGNQTKLFSNFCRF